jgi:type IV pilus assembly protein PilN
MIKINLAPRRRRRIAIRLPGLPRLGLVFGLFYALAIAGIGGYWFMLNQEAGRLQAEIANAQRELASLKTAIAEGNQFKKEKEDLERRVGLIDLIARNQARPVYLLDAVAEAIPRDLWLTTMEEKGNLLKLSGSAFSSTAVADLMANLRRSGKFKDVDLIVSRQDPEKTPRILVFQVSCGVGI